MNGQVRSCVLVLGLFIIFAVSLYAQRNVNFPPPFRTKAITALRNAKGEVEFWSVGGFGSLSVRVGEAVTRKSISGADLNSLLFVDDRNVYIVGTAGEVLLSRDRALTWEKQTSGTSVELTGISCVNRNTCWVVGFKDGLLLKGGVDRKWVLSNVVSNGRFTDVYFVNANVGYAVGWDGLFLKTKDGGEHWTRITIPARIDVTQFIEGVPNFEGVVFSNPSTGCAAGWDIGAGFVACTRDGGTTWKTAYPKIEPVGIVWGTNNKIFVLDRYGKNVVSTDFGESWHPQ